MRKFYIVLRGDHGGELARHDFKVRPEQEESAVIRNALVNVIAYDHWTLAAGDTITIEEA